MGRGGIERATPARQRRGKFALGRYIFGAIGARADATERKVAENGFHMGGGIGMVLKINVAEVTDTDMSRGSP